MAAPRDFAILNALVTFAAENIPGGLTEEERRVAQIIGRIASQEGSLIDPAVRSFEGVPASRAQHLERELFRHVPMQLNLSDYTVTSHLGWAAAYKDANTGEIRLDIRMGEEASERLEKDLREVFELKAIGFAGIKRKAE